jgi:hypothetical protein
MTITLFQLVYTKQYVDDDRESYANIASTTLVSKLNLYMIKHNRAYRL